MYAGGMGGGGNAWMKIMGIDQDKVAKRHQKEELEKRKAFHLEDAKDGAGGGGAGGGGGGGGLGGGGGGPTGFDPITEAER